MLLGTNFRIVSEPLPNGWGFTFVSTRCPTWVITLLLEPLDDAGEKYVVNKSLHKKLITYLDKLDLIRYITYRNKEINYD